MSSAPVSSRKFTHKGRDFEIRSTRTVNGIHVECFEDGKPTGVRGSIDLEVASDFAAYGHGSAEIVMVDAVQRYVTDILDNQ